MSKDTGVGVLRPPWRIDETFTAWSLRTVGERPKRSVAAEIKKYKYKKNFGPKLPEVASTRSPSPCESVPRRARSAKLPRTLHAIVIARCRFRRFSAASHFWVRTSFQAGGSRLRSRGRAPAHFRKSSWSGAHPFWPTRAGPNFAAKMPSSAY